MGLSYKFRLDSAPGTATSKADLDEVPLHNAYISTLAVMRKGDEALQQIYLNMVQEASQRLVASEKYLTAYLANRQIPDLESAVLQLRKALEAIAFASIAPNRSEYEALRATATKSPDFTKDFHALKIFAALERINGKFYPLALVPAIRKPDGSHHFDRKDKGFLSKKRFEAAYDRLGKYLHAHNPWSSDKQIHNLANDLPTIVEEARGLLDLHVSFIDTPRLKAAWVVETPRDGSPPRMFAANASGDYVVT
jgi:hypothetical protein